MNTQFPAFVAPVKNHKYRSYFMGNLLKQCINAGDCSIIAIKFIFKEEILVSASHRRNFSLLSTERTPQCLEAQVIESPFLNCRLLQAG